MLASLTLLASGLTAPAPAAVDLPSTPPVTAAMDIIVAADPAAALTFERPAVSTVAAPPRHPGVTLSSFLVEFEGTSRILPGYSTAECMAVWSFYHRTVVRGRPYSSPGAKDLWPQRWDEYDKVPASEPARYGDVVVWSGSYGAYQGGGWGHVAIVVEDHGSTLAAFGQNPNPATTLELSKSGVLGYLRPKTFNP